MLKMLACRALFILSPCEYVRGDRALGRVVRSQKLEGAIGVGCKPERE